MFFIGTTSVPIRAEVCATAPNEHGAAPAWRWSQSGLSILPK
jgi:hypothetical protein